MGGAMGVDARARIEDEVRARIRESGVDPARDARAVGAMVAAVIDAWDEAALLEGRVPLADRDGLARAVTDTVAGFGPLQPLLDDPTVEEIWINSPSEVYVARGGVSELTTILLSAEEVRALVERMLALAGRRLDLSSPFVDAALPGGERLHVAIPDVTRRHWAVNIRKYIARASHVEDLVALGTLTPAAARFLDGAVRAGLTVLVSGGTQAGKTTTLGALAGAIPPRERVISCEEVFELALPLRDVVALQCRQPSLEGTGEIPLRRLVKEALRMRPDRIVVGEVREAEALDLLIALLGSMNLTTVRFIGPAASLWSAPEGVPVPVRLPLERRTIGSRGPQRCRRYRRVEFSEHHGLVGARWCSRSG